MVTLLGALGGIALGFGLLSLLLAVFQPLMPPMLVWGNLLVGVLLLAVAGVLGFESLTTRLRSGAGRRAGAQGANAIVATGLALLCLGLLAVLSSRYSARFDWTEQKVNTLSEKTLAVLADLEAEGRPVTMTAFFGERDSIEVRDLLERYAFASSVVSLRFIDPNQRPDLVEEQPVTPDELARGLMLVTRGDVSTKVTAFGESQITNAFVDLSEDRGSKLYFLDGHNERKIGDLGSDPKSEAGPGGGGEDVAEADGLAGFSHAAAALRDERHEVVPLLLAATGEVPEDAGLLIIAGPTQVLFDAEREALERYLERGGALLVMLDPRARTNLYEDLARFGIEVGDDVVVDAVMSVNRQPTAPVAERYGPEGGEPHPIGKKLSRTVFSMARSVAPAEGADGIQVLVWTSPNAWAERSIEEWMRGGQATQDELDLEGPVPIAVVGRPTVEVTGDAAPRIAVFGDSNFATNELLGVFSNRDLLLNTVSWLLGDEAGIVVRPHFSRSSSANLTAGQLQLIQYLSLFVLPEGIALAGALAWWLRRRGGAA